MLGEITEAITSPKSPRHFVGLQGYGLVSCCPDQWTAMHSAYPQLQLLSRNASARTEAFLE